jgi:membrane-associated phospholipid phosphatase
VTLGQTLRRAGYELVVLDRAVYAAVQATPSPTVDGAVAEISEAANHSRGWIAIAAGLSVAGRRRRRAALVGLAALGVTSAAVNLVVKPVFRRSRPVRDETVRTRVVTMPRSASYPSGHAASAFAFSSAVGGALPELDTVLRMLATAVAYSRVHTGVHYPGDVIAGGVIGAGMGSLAWHVAERFGFLSGGSCSAAPRAASANSGRPAT